MQRSDRNLSCSKQLQRYNDIKLSKDSTSTLLLKRNKIIKDKTLCATFLTAC